MDDNFNNQLIRNKLAIIFTIMLIMITGMVDLVGQDLIRTTDDLDEIKDVYNSTGKLILAVYTEDRELEKDYFEYLEWHDSLVSLLNQNFIVYTMRSDYNAVELRYGVNGLLAFIELEEDQDELYNFLNKVTENKSSISRYIEAEKYFDEHGKFESRLQMQEYLTTAMDILQVDKEDVLNEYLSVLGRSEVIDSQQLGLVIYHTQTMGTGYNLLKRMVRSYQFVDDSIKLLVKESIKRVLENTYLDVLSFGGRETLILMFMEMAWFLENLEDQEWNNRYKYYKAKFDIAEEKKGDKKQLLVKARLFVNSWIMSQIKSNVPFLTAEEIAYDLAALTDLMLDRKIPKEELPSILPWIEESKRIYSGYPMQKVYVELQKKMGMKDKAKEEDRKLKWYKSNLSKEMIKSGERKIKDALNPEMILIAFMDSYFFPEQYVLP